MMRIVYSTYLFSAWICNRFVFVNVSLSNLSIIGVYPCSPISYKRIKAHDYAQSILERDCLVLMIFLQWADASVYLSFSSVFYNISACFLLMHSC